MLAIERLSRSYRGIPAISDASFTVNSGEIVGFLGPNGAGKSTTVKIITGLLRPNAGRVLFEGRDIHANLIAWRAQFGYIPEEAHLYTWMSAMEYLQLVGRLRGMRERVQALGGRFSLESAQGTRLRIELPIAVEREG